MEGEKNKGATIYNLDEWRAKKKGERAAKSFGTTEEAHKAAIDALRKDIQTEFNISSLWDFDEVKGHIESIPAREQFEWYTLLRNELSKVPPEHRKMLALKNLITSTTAIIYPIHAIAGDWEINIILNTGHLNTAREKRAFLKRTGSVQKVFAEFFREMSRSAF